MTEKNVKILLTCNMLLLLLCSLLLVKVFIFSDIVSRPNSQTVAATTVEQANDALEKETQRLKTPAVGQSNQAQAASSEGAISNKAALSVNPDIINGLTEQHLAEVVGNQKGERSPYFEPAKEDLEFHQRMLELEQKAAPIN